MIDNKMKSLIFHNGWHKGDCHLCRSFLKDIVAKNPSWKFYRMHAMERTLHDVPMEYLKKVIPGVPLVDIWIGSENRKYLEEHLSTTFYGIRPVAYQAMFRAICEKYNLECNLSDYIPDIDYSLYDTQKIDTFLSSIQKPCVIVSNGDVLSYQSHNFNMGPIIEKLKSFFTVVVTKDRGKKDEYFIGDIVERKDEDLTELSYLSTKSFAFIGRASGPYIFSLVKENFNGKLKMICIAKHKEFLYWGQRENNYFIPSMNSIDIISNEIMAILGVDV
jgi:hypothetical protein